MVFLEFHGEIPMFPWGKHHVFPRFHRTAPCLRGEGDAAGGRRGGRRCTAAGGLGGSQEAVPSEWGIHGINRY